MTLLREIFDEAQEQVRTSEVSGPILAVDIGSVNTRAVLLDVVEGGYRFVSHGVSPSTARAPWNDVLIGVYDALSQIAAATGRDLIDENGDLILAPRGGPSGVGGFVATASAGQPIRAILFGLMPDVSLGSGRRAADSIYLSLLDTFGLDDRRTTEERINVLLNAQADLVLVVGGTDGGATEVMREHLDTLFVAYALMKRHARPPVLFAGNAALADEIRERAEEIDFPLLVADNVRPSLGTEYLAGAQEQLASLYNEKKAQNTPGIAEISRWTKDGVQPTAHGFARMVHLLGALRKHNVLGVDLGSMATAVAASLDGRSYLNVFGQLGIGHAAHQVARQIPPAYIRRWLTVEGVEDADVLDYLWNRSVFPHTIPAQPAELEMEYAAAREIVRYAVHSARTSWQTGNTGPLPPFGTILLSGTTLTHTPTDGLSLLVALDALLPVGVTNVLLDPYGLSAALGAAAPLNPQALVQSLAAGAFYDLGPVVSVPGRDTALRGSLKPKDGGKTMTFKVAAGEIRPLPLAYGQKAELTLEGGALGGRRKLTVTGGALGVVIDARGRPVRFPRGDDARRKRPLAWRQALGEGVRS